ncbi:hypothetical protein H257_17633 [Aphanomyces astaci]|uniref:Core-binding (CB) domain-containing protein n=1 Tax=Aphanomyces astaci TaxID=112090 RepID=W4FE16_APHAT|nr:hypothetical protein H257_17633 [Aphanomyces astaci]ETV65747.1 hypothetical protein H257_17633 [Aphanomyces astaci]|eukprot:XP_009844799.1 hypothetical protein H257_17633 [Aphanomyces astaci]
MEKEVQRPWRTSTTTPAKPTKATKANKQTKPTTVASKKTIQDSFHGASTRRAYETYQNQFVAFLQSIKSGAGPREAGTEECTDFFHHMYTQGRKSCTIDLAKSALVAYFAAMGVTPNPAQDAATRRYIVGLQKYNKQHNVDEEKKAHPLSVHELSTLMNSLAHLHPFVGDMLRLLAVAFICCFRVSEVLALRWNDVDIVGDAKGRYLSVRLRWHKKANVEEDCQVYHLVDETTFPCLRVCGFYDEYIAKVRSAGVNISSSTFVFPNFVDQQYGRTPSLPIGTSLHSLRRGGTFFRVFESKERRLNFRELMAWNLLRTGSDANHIQWQTGSVAVPVGLGFSVDDIGQALAKNLHSQGALGSLRTTTTMRQSSMDQFVAQKSVPTARSALKAWQQWFVADPAIGLVCALKDYTKEMIRMDRKKYSERLTLGTAFSNNRAPGINTVVVPSTTWQQVKSDGTYDGWFTRHQRCTRHTFLCIADNTVLLTNQHAS